ncbi:MAG: hypothetical protein GY906_24535 [bacterium]|nr:hypothetical protein [bacterium]
MFGEPMDFPVHDPEQIITQFYSLIHNDLLSMNFLCSEEGEALTRFENDLIPHRLSQPKGGQSWPKA